LTSNWSPPWEAGLSPSLTIFTPASSITNENNSNREFDFKKKLELLQIIHDLMLNFSNLQVPVLPSCDLGVSLRLYEHPGAL
jgi:hypothetical protein